MISLTSIQNYIILKLATLARSGVPCLTSIQNYIILKPLIQELDTDVLV